MSARGVADPLQQLQRRAAGADGVGEPVGEVELPRPVVEERGPRRGAQQVGVRDRRLEVGQRLAVRPGRRGGPRRSRRELDDRRAVAGLHRVVHDALDVRRLRPAQRLHDPRVERAAAQARQRRLDGAAGQLVPEREPAVAQHDDTALLGR